MCPSWIDDFDHFYVHCIDLWYTIILKVEQPTEEPISFKNSQNDKWKENEKKNKNKCLNALKWEKLAGSLQIKCSFQSL